MTTKGELIKIGDSAYEVLDVFPPTASGETVIVRYDGLFLFAVNRGNGWALETPEDAPLTDEQKAVLRQYINGSGTLDTTTVDVEPS